MGEPYEIIAAPFEVYVAPVGTAFPDVAGSPGAGWTKLGTSGTRSMSEDGVKITHSQKIERDNFRMLGSTGPRKAVRTSEDLTIEFTLVDVSLEMYAEALAVGAYEDTSEDVIKEDGANKEMGLYRGIDVKEVALLVRGPSPYVDGQYMQFEVPRVFQDGNPTPTFSKSTPGALQFTFTALEAELTGDAAEAQRFGRLKAYAVEGS